MINDISQPLIFLGTNSNIFKIYELAENIGYTVAGIIDDDYHGQGKFKDLPIIAKEQNIADLKDQYQFFCVTNWMPTNDSVTSRNRQKRRDYIDLLDRLELDVATLVSPLARVSKYSKLGKGVLPFKPLTSTNCPSGLARPKPSTLGSIFFMRSISARPFSG